MSGGGVWRDVRRSVRESLFRSLARKGEHRRMWHITKHMRGQQEGCSCLMVWCSGNG